MKLGENYTRPAKIEIDCAEQLLELIPKGEMVKFAKDGSTVISAALRLARAYTGREIVAVCEDHPFFSYDDWFIGTTEVSAGVPSSAHESTLGFRYNDISSLAALFDQYPDRIACVIMEAARYDEPDQGYLERVQDLARENGALFVLDEMITGFRWDNGGGQEVYGLDPDLSGFGKAMANGFALSALVGKRDIMRLGGINHDKERVFLLSTTHGAENHALAAAISTMRIYSEEPVIEHLYRQGKRLKSGVDSAIESLGLNGFFELAGRPCNLVYVTRDQEKRPSQLYRTLFMQEIIKRGVIGPSFILSYSHSDIDINRTIEVVSEALEVYKRALEDGAESYLVGRPVQPAMRRFC